MPTSRIRPAPETPSRRPDENAPVHAVDIVQQRQQFMAMAQRHESYLVQTARRLCGTAGREDRALDLVQDTLVRAYEAILEGQFLLTEGEERRERIWLLRILTNRFINEYRRRQRWEAGIGLDTLIAESGEARIGLEAAAGDVPGARLFAQTLEESLEKALASLPEGHRICIVLCEIEGLDYAEVAELMKIPIGTVRSRLSRARLQLQKLLEKEAHQRGWRR